MDRAAPDQSSDPPTIQQLYRDLRPHYEQFLQKLAQQLRLGLEQLGLSVTVKARLKNCDAYCAKLAQLQKLQGSGRIEITDLLGIRIVCPFLEDLETVEQFLADQFEILELEHKAEKRSFHEFGYDSVHLLVSIELPHPQRKLPHSKNVCEIQLRTILQEAWAEVEHVLVYKSDIDLPNHTIRRKLASLNASLTLSDLIFQEIRDHQKQIRQRGLKRRQFLRHLDTSVTSDIAIARPPALPQETAQGSPNNTDLAGALTPRKLEQLLLDALELHSNNQFSEAIDLYSSILKMKLEPKIRSLIYNHRGMALFALADYQKGVEDFTKAVEYDEGNTRAWNNRGLALRVLEKHDQSLESYDRAISQAPQEFESYWGRAQTFFEMKIYSRALNDCRKALEYDSTFTPAKALEKAIHRQLF